MKKTLIATTVAVMAITVGILLYNAKLNRQALTENDAKMTQEVEQFIRNELAALGPDHEVSRRYGRFVSLRSGPYNRHEVGLATMSPRVVMGGRPKFEKAEVLCSVSIRGVRGPLKMSAHLRPSEEYLLEHPKESLVIYGSEFKVIGPNSETATNLSISVRHPQFFADVADMKRTLKDHK